MAIFICKYNANIKLHLILTFLCSNALPGSAVCAFNMSAFTTSFDGPFKYQEGASYAWERHNNKEPSLQKVIL